MNSSVYNISMNTIPELIKKRGWDKKEFVARCALKGMGISTAYRIANGGVNVRIESLLAAARVLDMTATDLAVVLSSFNREPEP